MTAEERLAQKYHQEKEAEETTPAFLGGDKSVSLRASHNGGVFIAAEDIDLIADLVVGRLLEKAPRIKKKTR